MNREKKQAINVSVPRWLHTSTKILAAEEETTVLALVIEGLEMVLLDRAKATQKGGASGLRPSADRHTRKEASPIPICLPWQS